MKHLVVGGILIAIGVSLFSPIEEIILASIFGLWILPLSMAIAGISLLLGIWLVGKSAMSPLPFKHHPMWLVCAVIITIIVSIYLTILWSP